MKTVGEARGSGKGVPAGKKSLAFRLTFGADERTLQDEEVDQAISLFVEQVKKQSLGAGLPRIG